MIPFPYNLIGALAVMAGVFFGGWTAQGWHRDSEEKARVEAQIETDRIAHIGDIHRTERVVAAQNAAQRRATVARGDADATRGELDSLRAQSDATVAAARVSFEACAVNATTLGAVFKSCAGRYAAMGETAQGHANDAQTLGEAWPVK
jgi:hypothetical protein